jgi:hypothetical protein
MIQVYHPYWKWECYKNGMWLKSSDYDNQLKEAIKFTGNHILYGNAMNEVIYSWRYTIEHHLSNKSINRRAFIGHCAVFYKKLIPEYIVRDAWKHLSDKQRTLADNEAEKAIKEWELWYTKKLQIISKLGSQEDIKKGYQMKLLLS